MQDALDRASELIHKREQFSEVVRTMTGQGPIARLKINLWQELEFQENPCKTSDEVHTQLIFEFA